MKASELRIGNYVNLTAEGHEKEPDIVQWSAEDYEFYEGRMSDVKPITLTTKLLEKADFEIDMNNFAYKDLFIEVGVKLQVLIMNDYAICSLIKQSELPFESDFEIGLMPIKYVHQLQNLYYQLTGIELTFNL